uniref:MYM-type domain-containing protein n=1 Tax=Neogobius melanostomus TaxID=47308 RepID=A0A8C6WDV4_9GOBI
MSYLLQNKLVFFCTQNCLLEFKTANALVNVCEYCKVEKVTKEVRRISNRDCHFCSDGERTTYSKHYCLTAHYGNSSEEFCSDGCRSKYTMLFCHVRGVLCKIDFFKLYIMLLCHSLIKHMPGVLPWLIHIFLSNQ